ncbi:MAG: type VI secretion system baseplate subunit TssK [Lysobacter sp.]|nr:type VI secretion system baseplate subunit TssK [Lysobacter sp.]
MTDNEFLPDAVQWSEGMLLSPQHFQQNDIHAQAMLHQRLASLTPHAWGVRRLQLDATRLADGLIKVTECDAVMPDGLPLVFRASASGPDLSLAVEARYGADGAPAPVRVFLAIPPRAGAAQGPIGSRTSQRRYESLSGVETMDEVTGIGDVLVERQRARIELFAEKDLPAGYPALPLLEIIRDAYGAVSLTRYHPPMFRIGASAFLGAQGLQLQFAALRNDLWEKLRELAGTSEDDAPESIAVLSGEARMHLRIAREIAACLPLIDTILYDPLCSLQQAWWAMAQIVGRMAAIGGNPRPLKMDPYRHDDCQPQFQAALAFVMRKLALVNTDWDSPEFVRVGDGTYQRLLSEDSPQTVYLELRKREGQSAGELQAWLGQARIASGDLMPVLRQRRLPGASVRVLGAREVSSLGLRADALIFAVSSERLEMPQGMVESFRPGLAMVVQGDAQHAPAAIILHHRKQAGGASVAPPSTTASESGHA